MKTKIWLLLGVMIFVACKNETKTAISSDDSKTVKEVKSSLEDALVVNDKMFNETESELIYNNIVFQSDGAFFDGNPKQPSFVEIPFTGLDLSQSFNVSFSYNTYSSDGSKPQTFIAFMDKFSSPARSIPFYLYTAGRRITGVYGDQTLWANNYDRTTGESKAYFDSYQLTANQFYFVSVNFTGSEINIYINSELYASFVDLNPHDLSYEKIVIGAIPQGPDYTTLFNGVFHGLKIFNRSLDVSEIIETYNSQPYVEVSEK